MKTAAAEDKPTRKSAKKSSGKPRRPMSAYNIFFRNERNNLILAQGHQADEAYGGRRKIQAHVGFENLAKIVSKKWHNIDPAYKEVLEKEAKLDKERYMKEMAAWKLKALDQDKEVIDLEGEIDDDDTSTPEGLQVTQTSNQGSRQGGGVQSPSLQHTFTSSGYNQSVISQSFTPNYVGAISTPKHASFPILGHEASSINMAGMPFIVEKNPQLGRPWYMTQGSLLFPNNVPTHCFQFEGRRNSMPDSFQGGRVDRMANFGASQHNRRASLFSSVRETANDDTLGSNFPPIEEIKRFFNIDPKTNKVQTPKFYCESCMD